MSSSGDKMVLLQSAEGKKFFVNEVTISVSTTIKHVIEETGTDGVIPLPNVRGEVLEKIIEYCDKCIQQQNLPAEYAKANQGLLLEILLAADYLNIRCLQALICQTIRSLLAGKSTGEELRSSLNIQGSFGADEEAHLRRTLTRLGCVLERQE
ncbi:hypothetical protein MKW92_008537 [Papaver armeniacum]|nr:hypothetical protein MKW92_008537 [Papaver armeniacum]